jgi:transcriptional regulator with XRE-family HTH domain
MGHLERGEKNVSFNTLVRLSEALGITLPELLSAQRKRANKPRKADATTKDDLPGIIQELNGQRQILEQSAGALKNIANALRSHERQSVKQGKR